MDFTLISPGTIDMIGIAGVCLYVTNYTLLSLRILTGSCVVYFCINLIASSFVLIGLSVNFNLAAALLQGFWITMSLIAISLRLARPARRPDRAFA